MSRHPSGPVLRGISPDASEEEVAAIVAAVATLNASSDVDATADEHLDEWVRGARLVSRRVGRMRGPWRFSGRVARRTRP